MSLDNGLLRLQQARARLRVGQGRVARRNGRRAFAAALTAARTSLDKEFPLAPSAKPDPIDQAADSLTWWQFEDDVIKHVSRRWDKDLAQEFVEFILFPLGPTNRPLLLDMQSQCPSGFDAGRQPVRDKDRWVKLFHEIAHLRVRGHRRAFVRELAGVYKRWREFLSFRKRRRYYDEPERDVTITNDSDQAEAKRAGLAQLLQVLKNRVSARS